MRSNTLTGVRTLFGFRPKINTAVEGGPDGLLRHEWFVFSLLPPHIGFRQYWRDWKSMEAWARSEPHREWWRSFLRGSSGAGFWHETYFRRHDMEAIYDDMKEPVGLLGFAPAVPARGGMFSARRGSWATTCPGPRHRCSKRSYTRGNLAFPRRPGGGRRHLTKGRCSPL